jgi:hypothetical protein
MALLGLFVSAPAFADDLDQPIQVYESVDLRSDVNLGIQTTYEKKNADSEAIEHQQYVNEMLPYSFSSSPKAPTTVVVVEQGTSGTK